jgi:hypothetical protein
MFFGSILGAKPRDDGWACPRRRISQGTLVVRINTFLETRGWLVDRAGVADEAVEREVARKRSFERTLLKARALREGVSDIGPDDVRDVLIGAGWDWSGRELLPHQQQGVIHGLTAGNAANFSVPGSGKTAIALAIAVAHMAAGTIDSVLVVGPLACFAPWERETALAVGDRYTVRRVRGSARRRSNAYQAIGDHEIMLVSFASAAVDRLALIDFAKGRKLMIVVDESHRVKRFRGGMWAPALVEIAAYARIRLILSGTPMPQSGRDLYTQLNVLWPGGQLTGPRDSFAARVDTDFNSVLVDILPFISRTPKKALGLPEYEVVRHQVPMSGTQAEIYDLIEANFRRRMDGASTWQDKIDRLKRGRPIRLLQAAANPDLLNTRDSYYRVPRVEGAPPTLLERLADYRRSESPAKSERAIELLADAANKREKVVCWSNFVPNLDQFSDLVRRRLSIPCYQIDGRVPTDDDPRVDDPSAQRENPDDLDTRERIIDRFLTESGPAVLVTNPASCSESISLHHGCHTAIYLDRTYDCAQFLQSIDRIHRLGLAADVKVTIHILLATVNDRATVDALVDASIGRKEMVMKQLLEGAELMPFSLSDDPLKNAEGNDVDLAELLHFLLGEER